MIDMLSAIGRVVLVVAAALTALTVVGSMMGGYMIARAQESASYGNFLISGGGQITSFSHPSDGSGDHSVPTNSWSTRPRRRFGIAATVAHRAARSSTQHLRLWSCCNKLNRPVVDEESGA